MLPCLYGAPSTIILIVQDSKFSDILSQMLENRCPFTGSRVWHCVEIIPQEVVLTVRPSPTFPVLIDGLRTT
jgi:hypothetical protein